MRNASTYPKVPWWIVDSCLKVAGAVLYRLFCTSPGAIVVGNLIVNLVVLMALWYTERPMVREAVRHHRLLTTRPQQDNDGAS